MAASVAVIGGGWAGLAAAVTLASQGVPATLFEGAAQLGGRARRVDINGLALDNGQHILIGAYRETLRVLEMVGVDVAAVCDAPPLTLQVAPDFYLRAAALPAPLHLAVGLFNSRGITWREKFSAVRFLTALKRAAFQISPDRPVAALLEQYAQSPSVNAYLWHPLCLAALNTPPALASAQVFVNVLRDAFFGTRADSRLLLPRVDLGQLFPDSAAKYITAHGGEIRLNQRISQLNVADGGFALQHAQGTEHFSQVICATAPFRVSDLLGHLPQLKSSIDQISALHYQPIYTIYLQYPPTTRLPFPMLGLTNTLSQWVFDRGALSGQPGLMSVIISAAGDHEKLSHATLADCATRDLHTQLGLPEKTDWVQVIAEKRATFSCSPSLVRPQNVTPQAGLYLAGDYTAGAYPATLEAAVRSGVRSAQACYAASGSSK